MIIYELEADYSNYLAALGAPNKLVRKYAYRNALLPQITGLALALGAVVAGAIVVEIVFSYPGPRHADAGGDPEPRLLPDPGDLPLRDHRRADREPHHRHRLRLHRPAHARRDAGRRVMAVSAASAEPSTAPERVRGRRPGSRARRRVAGAAPRVPPLRAAQLEVRLRRRASCSSCSLLAIFGPMLTAHAPLAFDGPTDARPSSDYWFGTTSFGQDVFSQFVQRPARGVPRRRRRRRDRLGDRRGRRLHGRLPRRLGRRRAEHAHERRARDPDAGDPDHRRRLHQRAQLRRPRRC